MSQNNLGNVVGLIRSTTAPDFKKYVIWAKILDEVNPDIVELYYYDGVAAAWIPLTSATASYWLKPVINTTTTSPPPSPTEGDRYLIADAASGDWSGRDQEIAEYRNSAWLYQQPLDGYIITSKADVNKIYVYEGEYDNGGDWVENDFNTAVDISGLVEEDTRNLPNGFLGLDANGLVGAEFIPASLLAFQPTVPGNWDSDTNTIWKALEFLLNKTGDTFNPSAPDTRPTDYTIGNIPAGTLVGSLRGSSGVELWQQALLGVTHPDYDAPSVGINASGNVRVEVGTIIDPTVTITFTQNDAGDLNNIEIFRRTPTDGDSYVVALDGGGSPSSPLTLDDSNYQLEDGQTLSYYGRADWDQGPVLLNGNNEPDETGRIAAGGSNTSVRRWYTEKRIFYGNNLADPTTSALIRALSQGWETQGSVSMLLAGGETSACIIIPAERNLSLVQSVSLVTADITSSFLATEETVTIEGANSGAAFEYDVKKYYLQPGAPFTAQTLNFFFS